MSEMATSLETQRPLFEVDANGNSKRLNLLAGSLDEVSALLLASLHGTHRDVFDFEAMTEGREHGVRTVSGTFKHKPTGRRYSVAVCAIQLEAEPAGDPS